MKYRRYRILGMLIAALLFSGSAIAVMEPVGGKADNRIREVKYDRNNVVRIIGYIGFTTQIFLGRDEKIIRVTLGNPKAWEATPVIGEAATFLIKPIVEPNLVANSNLIVQTDQRLYTFELTLGENEGQTEKQSAKGMMFQVRFCYEECESKSLRSVAAPPPPAEREVQIAPTREINRNYMGQGDNALAPEVWDDGVFTYMRFSAQQGPPAVYFIDTTGEESIPGRHTEKDRTMVYHGVWKQLRLRYSDKIVFCVFKTDPIKAVTPQQTGALPAGAVKERRTP
jgi:type IV secretion system protein VirB9